MRCPCGLGLPVLSLDCKLLTFSLSSPGSRTRVVMAPCHGFQLGRSVRLVDSGSSEQESAQSVRSFLSLRLILAFVRSGLESTLVPSLTAALLG